MSDGTRAWLLDLDGTIVDTHDANAAAYAQAISETLPSVVVDGRELRKHIAAGESCADFLPELVPGLSAEGVALVAAAKARAYPSKLGLSRLNRDLVSRIEEWRSAPGHVAVLVTTAKRRNALAVLDHHKIGGLFDHRVFGDAIHRLKPDPEIYLVAMDEVGLTPDECLAFEDSDVGVDAARAAGIAVRKVEWGVV